MAIVHDYLNQRGGGERVALALSDLWPQAPVYTSIYRPQSTFSGFQERDMRTSFLDRLPIDGSFRALFPLYAPAFKALGPIDADVVVASSSGWAHIAPARAGALHIVYCHTPARWLYTSGDHLSGSPGATAARALFPMLRTVDRRAARRADVYIANSANTHNKIRDAYGIDAQIIHPPVDTHRFHPAPRGDRLLVVSRLLPYKRVDLAVQAAEVVGVDLDVVGTGPSIESLKALAGPRTTFHGSVSDERLHQLLQSCWAVCVPGEEDFGIVPVEAQAAGKPVIAYGAGGALETVQDGVTGVLFGRHEVGALAQAIVKAQALSTDPGALAAHAARFSGEAFQKSMLAVVDAALAARAEQCQ